MYNNYFYQKEINFSDGTKDLFNQDSEQFFIYDPKIKCAWKEAKKLKFIND